jgi:hypothetical protein
VFSVVRLQRLSDLQPLSRIVQAGDSAVALFMGK